MYTNSHSLTIIDMMKYALTCLVWASLTLACSAPKSETTTGVPASNPVDSAQLAITKSAPASEPLKIQLFNNVPLTQKKLSGIGIGAIRNWHNDGLGWSSSSSYSEFGSPGIGNLRNSLALYLESSRQHEVQTLKIKVNMPNMNLKSRALGQYVSTVEKAFTALGQPMPEDLPSALWRGKPYQKETPTMSIENRLEEGKYISWVLIISSF